MSKSAIRVKPRQVEYSSISPVTMPLSDPASVLKYLQENGIVNLADVQEMIEMKKREELLSMHTFEIWQGKNGKWYTYLPDKEKGRVQRERTSKKAIEDVIISFWEQEKENPTIEDIFHMWNEYQISNKKISQATYTRNQQTFKRHFSEFGKKRINSIKVGEVAEFIETQVPKHKLKQRGLSNLKTLTRKILSYARRKEYTDINIEAAFDDLDISDRELAESEKTDAEQAFFIPEYRKLIHYLEEDRSIHNLGLLLLCLTGMRIGELVALKVEDIGENYVYIRRTESRYMDADKKQVYIVKDSPKTKAGIRVVPIATEYCWILGALKNLNPFNAYDGYIFVKNGERMHTECFRKKLYRVCDKLQIPKRSPHAIRKTFATICMNENVDERTLIALMGHTDTATTETYYHKDIRTIPEKTKDVDRVFGRIFA